MPLQSGPKTGTIKNNCLQNVDKLRTFFFIGKVKVCASNLIRMVNVRWKNGTIGWCNLFARWNLPNRILCWLSKVGLGKLRVWMRKYLTELGLSWPWRSLIGLNQKLFVSNWILKMLLIDKALKHWSEQDISHFKAVFRHVGKILWEFDLNRAKSPPQIGGLS